MLHETPFFSWVKTPVATPVADLRAVREITLERGILLTDYYAALQQVINDPTVQAICLTVTLHGRDVSGTSTLEALIAGTSDPLAP